MKNKLHITILFTSILFYANSFAQQTTYYIPGTGNEIDEISFEDTSLLTKTFDYCNGWAGKGFGLSGTQRGAPEVVNVIENPQKVAASGNQVLAFRSHVRDDAWHDAYTSECPSSIYGGADNESQDDFFMYGEDWIPADTPSVMMHVFLPSSLDDSGVTSLRMTVIFNGSTASWPGIWCYGNKLNIRGPGRADITITTNAPNGGKDTWWTLGLSVTPDGDIQYYATPTYVTSLTIDHCIGFNSVLSAENGYPYRHVEKNRDAIIMSSNRNLTTTETLIDRLYYSKETTTQVLSVSEHETVSIDMYPNPASDYLYIKGLTTKTSYKVFDGLGRAVDKGSISSSSDKIKVHTLSKGIYFLDLEGYKNKKFIKN